MNQQLIDDLKASKAELGKRGWSKGRLISMDGTVCTLGAIGCAVVPHFADCPYYDAFRGSGPFADSSNFRAGAGVKAVAHAIVPNCKDPVGVVAGINDKLDTRVEDIYNLFDKALAEAGGLA